MASRLEYRTIFLSDIHLGSRGCMAADLIAFLKRVECDKLYLVGDVIDMWRLRQRWHWPTEHNEVTRQILKMAKRGTHVVYVPGNHDEHARQYVGLHFGDVEITLTAEHTTADGKRLFVTHGDQFDMVVKHARVISVLGAWAYDSLIAVNTHYNRLRARLGLKYWSLSKYIKLKVKSACTFVARFEEALIDEARRKGFDGVVCGHIHKAEYRAGAVDYYNCGDWVESGTALVEHDDGTMQIIDAVALVDQMRDQKKSIKKLLRQPAARQRTTTPIEFDIDDAETDATPDRRIQPAAV
ncbi:MAG: UDP-2,3-diacylglucosamine diphosphatase [Planctomycetota bacterium]